MKEPEPLVEVPEEKSEEHDLGELGEVDDLDSLLRAKTETESSFKEEEDVVYEADTEQEPNVIVLEE